MTDTNPYKTTEVSETEEHKLDGDSGDAKLTDSLIVGVLSSLIGPISLNLYWLYHDGMNAFATGMQDLLFFIVEYLAPALLCMFIAIFVGTFLRKAGSPMIRSRKRSLIMLAGFLLSFFLTNFLLLINNQFNDDIFPAPITIPLYSATCGCGVFIATLLTQLGSLSSLESQNRASVSSK